MKRLHKMRKIYVFFRGVRIFDFFSGNEKSPYSTRPQLTACKKCMFFNSRKTLKIDHFLSMCKKHALLNTPSGKKTLKNPKIDFPG